MKIYLYYEDKNKKTYLDVPEDECTVMIQTDYERRLCEAEDGEEVMPRTVQEILDEEINKPTFNNNQTETRRHVSLDALEELGIDFVGEQGVKIDGEEFAELRDAIAKLKPEQQELLKKVFWEGIKQVDIAKSEGVDDSAISWRLARIYKRLKKSLKK